MAKIPLLDKWVGTLRADGRARSNLVIGKGRNVTKWPMVGTRIIVPEKDAALDQVDVTNYDNIGAQKRAGIQERQIPKSRARPRPMVGSESSQDADGPMAIYNHSIGEIDDFWRHCV